ncbi:N-acetylmuramoyl-L-alanine amidase family protein [Clostridium hydrogenum]|uniref:N-acetylmuramoyl-L-alanine amidase family protein n=1 Tax=Clostridium hydrogenum TaxID=2855764 RepID=UPI001F2B6E19|nr:N-acetylmuramoyl-L-alanine amidase [Clostridium hydrogenum]
MRGRKLYTIIDKKRLSFGVLVFFILGILIISGAYHSDSSNIKSIKKAVSTNKNSKINKIINFSRNSVSAQTKQKFVVCIDPGHGGHDNGTKGINGVFEKDVVLKVGLRVGEILEKNNIKVIYTRKDNTTILGSNVLADLQKRVQISNDSKANVFLSIHCNDYKNHSVRGIELWCNDPNTKSEELAKKIQDQLYQLKYTVKRHIKYRSNSSLYVLKHNNAQAAALVEIGYLSNREDCKFISSEDGQAKCAEAIAKAILEFAGV